MNYYAVLDSFIIRWILLFCIFIIIIYYLLRFRIREFENWKTFWSKSLLRNCDTELHAVWKIVNDSNIVNKINHV